MLFDVLDESFRAVEEREIYGVYGVVLALMNAPPTNCTNPNIQTPFSYSIELFLRHYNGNCRIMINILRTKIACSYGEVPPLAMCAFVQKSIFKTGKLPDAQDFFL